MGNPIKPVLTFLRNFPKKTHHALPPQIQSLYIHFYWKLLYILDTYIKTILRTYLPVFVFEGTEKDEKQDLIFAYAGTCLNTQGYWAQRLFPSGFRKQFLGRYWFRKIPQILKERSPGCDLLLTETNDLTSKILSQKPGFKTARWVRMEIDISKPLKKIWKRGKNDVPRRIRKHKLECEMTRDLTSLEDFYFNMHLPYIKARFEATVDLPSYSETKKMLSIGELFLIKKQDRTLAGTLLEYHKNKPKMRILGVRDGNWEYVRYGVVGATYYFSIIEMQKRGFKKLHIGGTRPILNDGLTKYKISISAEIIPEKPTFKHSLWMTLLKDSPSLRDFLTKNPFVYFSKENKPCRAFFMKKNQDMTRNEFQKKYRLTNCGGLEKTKIFLFDTDTTLSECLCSIPDAHAHIEPAHLRFIK